MMSRYHDTMIRTAGNVLELGAAIRDARKRRGWTQAELADKAGVSRQPVSYTHLTLPTNREV